jgi:F0F1-type ATP synthase alpha subunit
MLKDIPVEHISEFERELFEYLTATEDELLSDIRTTGQLSEKNETVLCRAIEHCKAKLLEVI